MTLRHEGAIEVDERLCKAFENEAHELLFTTADGRPDFHEPGEQGWERKPKLRGGRVDNAGGTMSNNLLVSYEQDRCAESHLEMKNDDGRVLLINVANLLALARIGATVVEARLAELEKIAAV
jgi:hypothetical protein|tara:strand:+ start:542 stop:910 length:369 start_codon:yes stop_codon:yes gene_type:complete